MFSWHSPSSSSYCLFPFLRDVLYFHIYHIPDLSRRVMSFRSSWAPAFTRFCSYVLPTSAARSNVQSNTSSCASSLTLPPPSQQLRLWKCISVFLSFYLFTISPRRNRLNLDRQFLASHHTITKSSTMVGVDSRRIPFPLALKFSLSGA